MAKNNDIIDGVKNVLVTAGAVAVTALTASAIALSGGDEVSHHEMQLDEVRNNRPVIGAQRSVEPESEPEVIPQEQRQSRKEYERIRLARLVMAEARGEYGQGRENGLEAMIAPASVVLNRVRADFGVFRLDTDIVTAIERSGQFVSPWQNEWERTHPEEFERALEAVDKALLGIDPTRGMYYFMQREDFERLKIRGFDGHFVSNTDGIARTLLFDKGYTGSHDVSINGRKTGYGNVFFNTKDTEQNHNMMIARRIVDREVLR